MRRRILSQNFLHSRTLVSKLIGNSSIGKDDTVLDIGAGRGIITEELLRKARFVIAVEIDTILCNFLQQRFSNIKNFRLVNKNFLDYHLPNYPYKIFANIPFSIEGKIIRKLLNSPNPPEDCYLVMRQDLSERLIGLKQECQFSIFYKPWFTFEIVHYFIKTDFNPYARMDTVLLRFTKNKMSLISDCYKKKYMMFVGQGFGGGKRLRHNLRNFLSHEQFRRLSKQYSFSIRSRPSNLALEKWIGIFSYLITEGKI